MTTTDVSGSGPPRASPPTSGTLAGHANNESSNPTLFVDPMMGTPLSMFVSPDVKDRPEVVRRIQDHGGVVVPGYSSVPYILVDPKSSSGQSLHRQYAGKKGKLVLDVRWILECVSRHALQAFAQNWAGCRVANIEGVTSTQPFSLGVDTASAPTPYHDDTLPPASSSDLYINTQSRQLSLLLPYHSGVHPPYGYLATSVEPPGSAPQPADIPYSTHPGPSRSIQGLAPATMPPSSPSIIYRTGGWEPCTQNWSSPSSQHLSPPETARTPQKAHQPHYAVWPLEGSISPQTEDSHGESQNSASQATRGRERTRAVVQPVACSSAQLVVHRRGQAERSPTPPTKVVPSTYGGNLFTDEDVGYLKSYIDYCQRQGHILSLREICERLAVKCPHHTFHSWRRYCNKHQVRLGGYALGSGVVSLPAAEAPAGTSSVCSPEPATPSISGARQQPPTPPPAELQPQSSTLSVQHEPLPSTFSLASHGRPGQLPILPLHDQTPALPEISPLERVLTPVPSASTLDPTLFARRSRSSSPPRALFRSTTGKGVAFTPSDVRFLAAFLRHRKARGQLDMIAFWNDVAARGPHHSRASWMKYYRRHKHAFFPEEGATTAVLLPPPAKKLRYSSAEDVLLARYQFTRPEGTSDVVFQEFARRHPHHSWKGWQEHARTHKAAIEHLVRCLERGEDIDPSPDVNGAMNDGRIAGN